jgi:hypothetical protein
MPKLKLALNIGRADAARLELKETEAGKEVDVDDKKADELIKNGWALDPDADDDEPPMPYEPTPADISRGVVPIQFSGPEALPPAVKAEKKAEAEKEKKRRGRPPKSGGGGVDKPSPKAAAFADNPRQ